MRLSEEGLCRADEALDWFSFKRGFRSRKGKKKKRTRCDEITKSSFVIEVVDGSRGGGFIADFFATSVKRERQKDDFVTAD